MYSATQLHYLHAMGIPAWQLRRDDGLSCQPAAEAEVTNVYTVEPIAANPASPKPVVTGPDVRDRASREEPKPADDRALADWLPVQPMQLTKPGEASIWGSTESGLLVLSECLPPDTAGTAVKQPFHGTHGKMFDAMLKGINLSRGRCAIAALSSPSLISNADESVQLGDFLQQLKPRLVLFFCFPGGCDGKVDFNDTAQKGLLQLGPGPCITSYHPHYLLNHPEHKRDAWEALKRVRQLLGIPD